MTSQMAATLGPSNGVVGSFLKYLMIDRPFVVGSLLVIVRSSGRSRRAFLL